MSIYRYKAINPEGVLIRDRKVASSSQELKYYLNRQGFIIVSYMLDPTDLFSRKVSLRALLDLCHYLEQFETAGISLKESLNEIIQVSEIRKLNSVLREVMNDIEAGLHLSNALSKHPSVFDPIFVGLIVAGEKSGRLSIVLHHLFLHLKWVEEVHVKTLKALRYPFIMAIILLVLIIVLMTVMVPEVIVFMKSLSSDLPFSTHLLIEISEFLSKKFVYLFISFCALVFLTLAIFKIHPKGIWWKDQLISFIPFVGPLRSKLEMARFCHIFSVLFESGIDILQALQISQKSMKSGRIKDSIQMVERYVREGHSLSQSFEKITFFPKIIVRMIKIGEQTSSLQKSLVHVNDYFETSLTRQLDAVIGYIEPIMIVCVGLVMAWIIYSVFLPLYDAMSIMEY